MSKEIEKISIIMLYGPASSTVRVPASSTSASQTSDNPNQASGDPNQTPFGLNDKR